MNNLFRYARVLDCRQVSGVRYLVWTGGYSLTPNPW